METLLAPPQNELLLQLSLDDLHHTTTEWISKLEFCKTELSFLTKLLDKYFLRVKGNQKITELTSLSIKVKSLRNKALKELHNSVIVHERNLASLHANMLIQDEQAIREEHLKFNLGFKEFMSELKKLKQETFNFLDKELKLAANGRK